MDKKFIIALVTFVGAFLLQFAGSVWWASALSKEAEHLVVTLEKISINSYTKAEAAQQTEAFYLILNSLKDRVASLEKEHRHE